MMMDNLRIWLILFSLSFLCILVNCSSGSGNTHVTAERELSETTGTTVWHAPDSASIPQNDTGKLILYGMELVRHTAKYLGPKGIVSRFANGMNCQNCHLDAGRKLFANNYSAVYANYPKFRPRSGSVEHIEKRVNDCMERSLNGKKLDSMSREMRAFVAYINWVGKDEKKDVVPEGVAVVDLPWLYRAADRSMGKIAFEKHCVTCHGIDGQGKWNDDKVSYIYPPLWGPQSYNTGAGLYRITRLAGFIKSNMPNLTSSYNQPTLTDEEAWDIAAFICSKPRPHKPYKQDWPDISTKPVDYPFGPYSDQFSETRHKYGPYKGILIEADKHRNFSKK